MKVFISPIKIKGRLSSPFGMRIHPITKEKKFHNGVDIGIPTGTDIFSISKGEVKNVYTNEKGGKQIIILHSNGWKSGYAHLNKIFVHIGDKVLKGGKIAESGNTGQSTGSHLHFTLRNKKNVFENPETYITFLT